MMIDAPPIEMPANAPATRNNNPIYVKKMFKNKDKKTFFYFIFPFFLFFFLFFFFSPRFKQLTVLSLSVE
jgi:hypothetical protein